MSVDQANGVGDLVEVQEQLVKDLHRVQKQLESIDPKTANQQDLMLLMIEQLGCRLGSLEIEVYKLNATRDGAKLTPTATEPTSETTCDDGGLSKAGTAVVIKNAELLPSMIVAGLAAFTEWELEADPLAKTRPALVSDVWSSMEEVRRGVSISGYDENPPSSIERWNERGDVVK